MIFFWKIKDFFYVHQFYSHLAIMSFSYPFVRSYRPGAYVLMYTKKEEVEEEKETDSIFNKEKKKQTNKQKKKKRTKQWMIFERQ